MNKNEFLKNRTALITAHRKSAESIGAHKSETSKRCPGSMFTTDSSDCFGCTYCSDCTHCFGCTHCASCENVHGSSYCRNSKNLSGCSYVSLSEDCHECLFCVGCCGLVNKEFHILNEPYPRDVYFKKLAALEKALGQKLK